MTASDLHDLLDHAGDRAPRVDVAAMARVARASAVRRHRRRLVAVPVVAVVAVLGVVGTLSQVDSGGAVENQPRSAAASPTDGTLSGLLSSAHPSGSLPAGFACCMQTDIQQAARPGSTFLIHWIPVGSGPANRISLSVTLTGPYDSVQQLKSGGPAAASYPSVPLIALTGGKQPPVSTITLPTDAAPGLYNLRVRTSKVYADGHAGTGVGGSSIVTVTQ